MSRNRWHSLAAIGIAASLAGCDLAPNATLPKIEIPASYKEAGPWRPGQPADDQPRGPWWTIYQDKDLSDLETQLDANNASLAIAVADYDRARALAAEADSASSPLLTAGADLSDNRQSDNRPLRSKSQPTYYGANTLGVSASYEVDLWGRVRNLIAAGQAEAQASAADLASIRLSLEAELATDYVAIRGLDSEIRLLSDTVTADQKARDLTKARFQGKIASAIDVTQAETQLATVQSQLTDQVARRAVLEHAIAVLVGLPPANFALAPAKTPLPLPTFPAGIPSELLQRRPDIAAAERRVTAANAEIGVAEAAFYPSLELGASAGMQNTSLNLASLPNRFWSVGPAALLPIIDGGLRRAELAGRKAEFDIACGRYRETVLRAMQDVEDNLALLQGLQREEGQEHAANDAAQATLALSMKLYHDGVTSYLEVVSAQTTALETQRALLSIQTRLLQASVALNRAIGGGWSIAMLQPDSDRHG